LPKRNNEPPDIKRYNFPYVRFHGKHYPLVPVTLRRARRLVKTFALLDSGASVSVFRPEIAQALKIPKKNRAPASLGTADGSIDIEIGRVGMSVGDTSFQVNIGFSVEYAAQFNILGREGIFTRFSVCFNEIMRTVIMVPLGGK
jgi:hypothetical protein